MLIYAVTDCGFDLHEKALFASDNGFADKCFWLKYFEQSLHQKTSPIFQHFREFTNPIMFKHITYLSA